MVGTLLARKITKTIHEVPDKTLKENYKSFLERLEDHLKAKEDKPNDSKELIRDFLSTKLKLYKGVEVTVHIICAAAVKLSVESDVESLVSRYDKHLKVDRQMDEENAEEEMEIAENGPLLVHADLILKKAMHRYWKDVSQNGEWHFVMMKSESLFKASKIMDRLKSEKSKLSFMDY